MRLVQQFSHLNGLEFLESRQGYILREIKEIIKTINANDHKTKISKEKTMTGKSLYNPKAINKAFKDEFYRKGWKESRYSYCVTTDRKEAEKTQNMTMENQKKYYRKIGKEIITSYNQTDFVKDKVAVEVQFGKYSFVAYDLFVKHMLFYTGGVINVGIEILPMKEMQKEMSSGVAYYEGEVYKLIRQGRTSPPVPLLIIGIAP
jgi:hypothetical protein